jgi:integral membrane protein
VAVSEVVTGVRPSYAGALLRYRIMAYATGVALLTGCIMWLLTGAFGVDHLKIVNAIAWIAHGWLFLIYAVTALQLGIKLRWPIVRIGLVVVAGTIPLMSFVAERYVVRTVHATESAGRRG